MKHSKFTVGLTAVVIFSVIFSCRSILWGHNSKNEDVDVRLEKANETCLDSEGKRADPKDYSKCIEASEAYCKFWGRSFDTDNKVCLKP